MCLLLCCHVLGSHCEICVNVWLNLVILQRYLWQLCLCVPFCIVYPSLVHLSESKLLFHISKRRKLKILLLQSIQKLLEEQLLGREMLLKL